MGKKIKKSVYLSQCPLLEDVDDIIDWCIDRGYERIINDYTIYQIEYELGDLYQVWDNLRKGICRLLDEIDED